MGAEDVWNLVAFLQRLPQLDETKYREMVARSGGHHHDRGERVHQDESEPRDSADNRASAGHAHGEQPDTSATPVQADTAGATKGVRHTHADGTGHRHPSQKNH